jgi:hypothetical protein
VRFVTGVAVLTGSATAGVRVAPGGVSWLSISDRRLKENLVPVDGQRALEALGAMPVESWSLIAQPDGVRHVGPVAQTFNASFGYLFGEVESETHINQGDAIGVTMAALQGLYQRLQTVEAENASLRAEMADLREMVNGQ